MSADVHARAGGRSHSRLAESPRVSAHGSNGHAGSNGHGYSPHTNGSAAKNGEALAPAKPLEPPGISITSVTPVRDARGEIRYFRTGTIVTHWEIKHELPGRLRLKNPVIHRKAELCQAIERGLMGVLGIDYFKTTSLTSTVLAHYDRKQLSKDQILETSIGAGEAENPAQKDKLDLHLPLCTASVPVAAMAQFAAPGLLPAAAVLFAYTSIPTFKAAREVLVDERRLGVDVLDAIVVIGCLGTMSIFPGTVLCWCLGFGRVLVKKTQDDSKKLLLNAFGKQPRIRLALPRRRRGSDFARSAPAAGCDRCQHRRGRSGRWDHCPGHGHDRSARPDRRVDAGGERSRRPGVCRDLDGGWQDPGPGRKIGQRDGISQDQPDPQRYRRLQAELTAQGRTAGRQGRDPDAGGGSGGPGGDGARGGGRGAQQRFRHRDSHRRALAMLSSLALSQQGHPGQGWAIIELMNEVDTVLFDKTGTLTRERPEVGRMIASHGFAPERILQFAAAAEHKFHHPIALAILHKAQELGLELPPTDDTRYKVGYGIAVGVEGHPIRIGSKRFMDLEGVEITPKSRPHRTIAPGGPYDGDGVGRRPVRGSDRAARRGQARGPSDRRGVSRRGIKHIAIISGDHEAPPTSWPSRWGWTATSHRSCPPTRPTM